ncbi:hypothetical protein T10_1156 [Trichinella papuae]|uniref:Uncharacterized protein n=1 Tax=Trichinella papuae TaxID=268474 RepID=A0A0V1N3N7_9BILA|nr:hypothetical protein T10_1156 [Trichinella papuae]
MAFNFVDIITSAFFFYYQSFINSNFIIVNANALLCPNFSAILSSFQIVIIMAVLKCDLLTPRVSSFGKD